MATIALQFVPTSLAQTEHSWPISIYIYISGTIIGLSIIIAVIAVIKDRKLALASWLLLFGLLFPSLFEMIGSMRLTLVALCSSLFPGLFIKTFLPNGSIYSYITKLLSGKCRTTMYQSPCEL